MAAMINEALEYLNFIFPYVLFLSFTAIFLFLATCYLIKRF